MILLTFKSFFCNSFDCNWQQNRLQCCYSNSQLPFCNDFPAYLFSTVEKSLRNLSPCLSLTGRPGSVGRSSSGNVDIRSSVTCCSPPSGVHLTSSQQVPCKFWLIRFQLNLNKPHSFADSSVSVNRCSDRSLLMITRILGPIDTSSFNLASLSFGNFSLKFSQFFSQIFSNCLSNFSLKFSLKFFSQILKTLTMFALSFNEVFH